MNMKWFSAILDFLFPPACPICRAIVSDHGTLCPECWREFNWISNPKCCCCGYPFPADLDLGPRPLCPVCAAGLNELDWMRAACVYDQFSKNVMLPFKHAGTLKYQKLMSRAMIGALHDLDAEIDLVLPVPLARRRLFKRGYNQATLLARPIAKQLGARLDVDSVRRKYRPDMGHKNARERLENIRGAFSCVNPDNIRGKTVLLVDDVMTTGATFTELCKVLKRAGARRVYGVVFCRVIRAI
jgi:ComF family protein